MNINNNNQTIFFDDISAMDTALSLAMSSDANIGLQLIEEANLEVASLMNSATPLELELQAINGASDDLENETPLVIDLSLEKERPDHCKCINATQKNIIEAVIQFWFDDILDEKENYTKRDALKAFTLTTKNILISEDIQFLNKHDIIGSVKLIRTIFLHPCPENRSSGTPEYENNGVENGMVTYFIGEDEYTEQQGIFGLKQWHDPENKKIYPITKKAVIQYVLELMNKEMCSLRQKISKTYMAEEVFKIPYIRTLLTAEAEKQAFLSLKSQILGTTDNAEARLVRSIVRTYIQK